MSLLNALRNLINGNATAQKATQDYILTLAKTAIESNSPDQLMAVATQWRGMIQDSPGVVEPVRTAAVTLPSSVSVNYTTADELRPFVIKVMQDAYANGQKTMTNREIQKAIDRIQQSCNGWKDGDVEDTDSRQPGIQERWKRTLSQTLASMRTSNDISNSPEATKTYTLGRQHLPAQFSAVEVSEPPAAIDWEVVG